MRFEYGRRVELAVDGVLHADGLEIPYVAGTRVDMLDVDDPLAPTRVKVGVPTLWESYHRTGWVDLSALAPCRDAFNEDRRPNDD